MSENEWNRLADEIENCTRCRLHASRRKVVIGEGNKLASVLFVGEAPGEKEDESGRPFVGPAGKLLTELIESVGFKREDFYITNILKCRPPANRDPQEDEIEKCLPYLLMQIKLIKPRIIVALGRHSARTLFKLAGLKWISMSVSHGRVYTAEILGVKVKIIPTYHPASALYNPSLKEDLERDFRDVIRVAIQEITESSQRKQQKSLFDYARSNKSTPPRKNVH